MEVWNGIWKKNLVWNGIWNGRFSVWNGNGMEDNCQYEIWKNRLPFHTMPWIYVRPFDNLNPLIYDAHFCHKHTSSYRRVGQYLHVSLSLLIPPINNACD